MLTAEELRRYRRHLSLPGFGLPAQERLKEGKVLVIGAGGLGCPALLYLAAAGVGRIVVVDPDRVEGSNLQRQVLYSEEDIGKPKAGVCAERLSALNSFIDVVAVEERFRRENALELVGACDVVVDGSDNFATRYLVNDACVMTDRPFVYGAVQGFEGQLSVFNWRGGPTYRCLFPLPPPAELAPNCAEAGVLGILPGMVGTWQACEAIKVLAGVGEPLSGKLLLWNALTMNLQTVRLAADPKSRPIRELNCRHSIGGVRERGPGDRCCGVAVHAWRGPGTTHRCARGLGKSRGRDPPVSSHSTRPAGPAPCRRLGRGSENRPAHRRVLCSRCSEFARRRHPARAIRFSRGEKSARRHARLAGELTTLTPKQLAPGTPSVSR